MSCCMRQVGEVPEYLEQGPGFIFLYHPALGPLWDVIGQKVRFLCRFLMPLLCHLEHLPQLLSTAFGLPVLYQLLTA